MTVAKAIEAEFPGRQLIDATEGLAVKVTKADIKISTPGKPTDCAFSWACYRENPQVEEVIVFKSVAYLVYKNKIVRYLLNSAMQQEIVSFDRGATFEPGEYRLSPPPQSQRLDNMRMTRAGGPKKGQVGKHKPRVRRTVEGVRKFGVL